MRVFGSSVHLECVRIHVWLCNHISLICVCMCLFARSRCRYQGVVIYNMADLPIGFGITAATTDDCRKLEATGIVVFHQADVGEFLRDEDSLS